MKNKKGSIIITLIISLTIMIILASTSIIVGNKLVIEAKENRKTQNIETVKTAISRIQATENMSRNYYTNSNKKARNTKPNNRKK